MREKRVIDFYVLCNRLKNVIRTGWLDWHVSSERVESVAEHVYGTLMLALAVYSEYQYDVDIKRVILMLAIHELEEIKIGDLTPFQISKKEKIEIGHQAVSDILKDLNISDDLMSLILEFDERRSKEALFAHYVDKLECDLQCKLYDLDGCVDLNNQDDNKSFNDKNVQSYLNDGRSWSDMWILFGQERHGYDDNFMELSNYIIDNDVRVDCDC